MPRDTIDETRLIGALRALPVDVLLMMDDWLERLHKVLRQVIVRETNNRTLQRNVSERLGRLRLAGQQAWFIHKASGRPLPDCAADVALQVGFMTDSVLIHARDFKAEQQKARRDKAVLLVAAGFTMRETAKRLEISPATVSRAVKRARADRPCPAPTTTAPGPSSSQWIAIFGQGVGVPKD